MDHVSVAPPTDELETELERHRGQLKGFCYRMLGSVFETEDAVQETFLRAWRGVDRLTDKSALKSWLFRIATNVCLDLLHDRRRRARPEDLAPASPPWSPMGTPLPQGTWIEPIPDSILIGRDSDPVDAVIARESIRLAFVAALQHLPPRQRAVLILREVLNWQASEVAELLDTTVASVNSALQRARATLATCAVSDAELYEPLNLMQQTLLSRYVEAFERYDVATLVSLLHHDATMSMPPFAWWLRGREAIRAAWLGTDGTCHGSRLIPVVASGMPAFGQYVPSGLNGEHEPWALQVLDVAEGRIRGITSFLFAARLFPLFGLPPRINATSTPREWRLPGNI
jgi:RNA polymerase sigma-70 factor (ECF subfamily)